MNSSEWMTKIEDNLPLNEKKRFHLKNIWDFVEIWEKYWLAEMIRNDKNGKTIPN